MPTLSFEPDAIIRIRSKASGEMYFGVVLQPHTEQPSATVVSWIVPAPWGDRICVCEACQMNWEYEVIGHVDA